MAGSDRDAERTFGGAPEDLILAQAQTTDSDTPGAGTSGSDASGDGAAGDGTATAPAATTPATPAADAQTTVGTPATSTATQDPPPISWAKPGETDQFAMYGLLTLMFIVFVVIYIYAIFDRFAEHRGLNTPLRTTIPTMLTIGLAYDLLPPLEGFSILLPAALIVAALARDVALWIKPEEPGLAGGTRR